MNSNKKTVVTRFAPSPTGFLHIGGIRTALFSFLLARKNNGTFILRIEDTDKEREVSGSIEHIQESLRWLKINWDFGPDNPGDFGSCIQSKRLDRYMEYAEQLVKKGLAYPDPYSKEELDAFRKEAEEQKKPFLFREHRPPVFGKWDGKQTLRLKVPEVKRYRWHDAVRGDLEAGEEALDDFVLMKADGYPTYNFAHIVDDYLMGVTHVLRADEFISSTPRFLSLHDALDIVPPVFATLPPIQNEAKTKKLGKRDGAKDILDYRRDGYLPEAMVNFLALIGWNPGTDQEIFSMDELIEKFDLSKVQKSGGAFNQEKLLWMNKEYMKKLPESELVGCVIKFLPDRIKNFDQYTSERLMKALPAIIERISTFGEITNMAEAGELDFYFSQPAYNKDMLRDATYLKDVHNILTNLKDFEFTADGIKNALWNFATEKGRSAVLWPLRVALSGREKSPDPFTLGAILGKEEVLSRLLYAANL